MDLIVQKFGGSSVQSTDKIESLARHIRDTVHSGAKVVAVVSAMGDHTDSLLKLAYSVSKHPSSRELDMLLSAGERVSMALMSIALHKYGVDCVSLTGSQCGILTDGVHGNAKIKNILGDRIKENLANEKVVIVAGFQGVNPETKEITTLGRGGSDLTAVAIAVKLGAKECELYKDVAGIMTADPHKVPQAKIIKNAHYDTVLALADHGASVLHNRSILLAQKYGVALKVRPSHQLAKIGTLVSGDRFVESPKVSALTSEDLLTQLQLKYAGNNSPAFALPDALKACWAKGVSPIISRQATNKNVTLVDVFVPSDKIEEILSVAKKQTRLDTLELQSHRIVREALSSLTIAGQGFLQAPDLVERISSQINNVSHITMSITPHSVTYVVSDTSKEHIKSLLTTLHAQLIESN